SKGGPYDTIDEMLLVKGWTPKLLYGNDKNRNGRLDPDEDDGSGQVDLGFQKYFTVYSRELNVDSTGQQRINLMSTDLADLKSKLDAAVGTEISDYLILARITKQQAVPQSGLASILQSLSGSNRPKAAPAGVGIQDGKVVISDITKLQADSSVKYTTLWDFMDQYVAFSPPGNSNPPP